MREYARLALVMISLAALSVSCGRPEMAMAPADPRAADDEKSAEGQQPAQQTPGSELEKAEAKHWRADDKPSDNYARSDSVSATTERREADKRDDFGGGEGAVGQLGGRGFHARSGSGGSGLGGPRFEPAGGAPSEPTIDVSASTGPGARGADVIVSGDGRVDRKQPARASLGEVVLNKPAASARAARPDQGVSEEEEDREVVQPEPEPDGDESKLKGSKHKALERSARRGRTRSRRSSTLTLDGLRLDDDEDGDELRDSEEQRRLDPYRYLEPERFLARQLYFENTYLGGAAGYMERLRRLDEALGANERPYRLAHNYAQPFDAPTRAGLRVSAQLDTPSLDRPQRVFLQVGLQGSERYGWRRPPLDVVLVIDRPVLAANRGVVTRTIMELLRKLENSDRLAVLVAGSETRVVTPLSPLRVAQRALAKNIETLSDPGYAPPIALSDAMERAGQLLAETANQASKVPGTQTVVVLTRGSEAARIAPAAARAHELTVKGAVTSVIEVDGAGGAWWQVANAGHGNYHRVDPSSDHDAIAAELASLARVVARLVRVNIRLGKHARAIRILGTRVLDEEETRQVKAREVATDKSLSRAMGIKADRGDDDDGLQTVIPYFYGDDSHVILVELWVDGPGTVADVTVRYKDMVGLDNATARTSVKLTSRPQPANPEQLVVRRNVRGFKLGELLQRAGHRVRRWDRSGALSYLAEARQLAAATSVDDRRMLDGFQDLLKPGSLNDERRRLSISESLLLAGQRKVGEPAPSLR